MSRLNADELCGDLLVSIKMHIDKMCNKAIYYSELSDQCLRDGNYSYAKAYNDVARVFVDLTSDLNDSTFLRLKEYIDEEDGDANNYS